MSIIIGTASSEGRAASPPSIRCVARHAHRERCGDGAARHAGVGAPQRLRGNDIVLTDDEQVVRRGKVTGLVECILRGLRDKRGVATACAMCEGSVSVLGNFRCIEMPMQEGRPVRETYQN